VRFLPRNRALRAPQLTDLKNLFEVAHVGQVVHPRVVDVCRWRLRT